jgi:putative lipoprotein
MGAGQLRVGAVKQTLGAMLLAAAHMSSAAAAPPLRGTAWMQADSTAHVLLDRTQLRFTGQGACNRLSGGFKLEGDRLSFGPVASTRRACFPDDGSEARFIQALGQVRQWRQEGVELLLLAEDGQAVLRLRAGTLK